MVATFASVAEAVAADVKAVRLLVTIYGIPTDVYEVHVSHGVNQPVGTASIVLPAPVPAHAALNAPVEIQAGYAGATARIFSGRIPSTEVDLSDSGSTATIRCVGWASLLAYPDEKELHWTGPIEFRTVVRALCKRRNVPLYSVAHTFAPDGSHINLAGVSYVDGGDVVIPVTQTPLDWIDRTARLFGYRIFDRPDGFVAVRRISGIPEDDPAATYAEGVNAYAFQDTRDSSSMVTYWDVKGARYTLTTTGKQVVIRSIPASVPFSETLDPPGYRRGSVTDATLVTQHLADSARNVLEIDGSAPTTINTWEVDGDPLRQPGETVHVQSDSAQRNGDRWLTSIDQSVTDQGYYATMSGTLGKGHALPAGDDCVSVPIGDGVYHIGDETLSSYAQPVPDGLEATITFTVLDDYTTLTITAVSHGCNHGLTAGETTTATPTSSDIPALGGAWAAVDSWDSTTAAGITRTRDETGVSVPASVVKAIMKIESNGDPDAGPAHGLMQITSSTLGNWDTDLVDADPAYGVYAGVEELALRYLDSGQLPWENVACGYFSGHYYPDGSSDGFNTDYEYVEAFTTYRAELDAAGGGTTTTTSTATLSTFEIWQLVDPLVAESDANPMQRVGGGTLPVTSDRSGIDYGASFAHWQSMTIPITGSLLAGDAELRIIAGQDATGDKDDFEITQPYLVTCGVGAPTLPTEV